MGEGMGREKWEMTANGYKDPFWDTENILNQDYGHGCTIL